MDDEAGAEDSVHDGIQSTGSERSDSQGYECGRHGPVLVVRVGEGKRAARCAFQKPNGSYHV